jgi:hypothetical protein
MQRFVLMVDVSLDFLVNSGVISLQPDANDWFNS